MKFYFFPNVDRRIRTDDVVRTFPTAVYEPSMNGGKGGYTIEVENIEQLQRIFFQTRDEGQGGCKHIKLFFDRQPNEDGVMGYFYFAC